MMKWNRWTKLLKSIRKIRRLQEFKIADTLTKKWRLELANGTINKKRAAKILNEKDKLFKKMREKNPVLYMFFRSSDKELSEIIFRKNFGIGAIID